MIPVDAGAPWGDEAAGEDTCRVTILSSPRNLSLIGAKNLSAFVANIKPGLRGGYDHRAAAAAWLGTYFIVTVFAFSPDNAPFFGRLYGKMAS